MNVFLDFIKSDWYFAFPMFGMSLTAIALVVWRILLNRAAGSDLSTLLPALQEKLNKEGVEGAVRFLKSQPGLIPKRILAGGLETSKQGMAAMRRAMANSMELEVLPDLNFLLPTILAIAKIATMVGLLGTVISMIGTFSEIQELTQKGLSITSKSGAIGLRSVRDGPGPSPPSRRLRPRPLQGVIGNRDQGQERRRQVDPPRASAEDGDPCGEDGARPGDGGDAALKRR